VARQRVFLAFAHADRVTAHRIARQLRDAGLEVWDAADVRPGDDFPRVISEELQAAAVLVALITPAAERSGWVRREIEYALVSRTPVVPLLAAGEPYPALAAIQHDRLEPDGAIHEGTVERIEGLLRRTGSGEASQVAAGVLRALDSRILGEVVAELQERIVLLLGNFADKHYDRLLRLQAELRRRGLHPVIFDFKQSPSSDYGETVRVLAGLSSFVIADMTDPRSVVMELQLIAPDTAVPIVPVIAHDQEPVALFADLIGKYDWVLTPVRYNSPEHLADQLDHKIIEPAATKRDDLHRRKRRSAAAQIPGLRVGTEPVGDA
jgi:hypothetical protein